MKRCPRCGATKTLEDFPRNRSRADGHGAYCKSCHYQDNRRHPESTRRYDRARGRALTLLARRHPDEFRRLIAEVRERDHDRKAG